ncbi:hypothetical protein ACFO4E_20420 [Nocardiopsis mangrovi]|uniref:Ribosomal protein L7/L12 C-terminal domain-containing protein n=1 Tax=Nocardiopsis mangrovi TaxID=1179818 RepID=A0ABV9E2K8_9ACTN
MDSEVVGIAVVAVAIVAGIAGGVLIRAGRRSGAPARPRPVTEETLVRARVLIGQRKQIQAIKGIREETGMGLKEAKELADALREGRPLPAGVASPTGSAGTGGAGRGGTLERARLLIRRGKQIQAIKGIREETGMGLKEAKELADALRDGRPLPASAGRFAAPAHSDLAARVRDLRAQGREDDAIRVVVTETGMSTAEAAGFLDSLGDG